MKRILLSMAMVALCTAGAAAQGAPATTDSLTGLPLMPAAGQGPSVAMPPAIVCKSNYRGNFYSTSNTTMDAAIAWLGAHLHGFGKAESANRSTVIFFNRDRSLVVIVIGRPGGAANSLSYERYQPGLPPATITGMTQGKILCH